MLESMASVLSRIDEIKCRFRNDPPSGVVQVAPHYKGMPQPGAAGAVDVSFSDFLDRASVEPSVPAVKGHSPYEDLISSASAKHGLDNSLLRAVIRAESGFNPRAVSNAGAQGLAQLMPATSAALGVTDPFDPEQSINAGARYLRQQLDRFGNVSEALAAYNAGPGAVAKHGGVPPFRETRDFVNRVLGYRGESP